MRKCYLWTIRKKKVSWFAQHEVAIFSSLLLCDFPFSERAPSSIHYCLLWSVLCSWHLFYVRIHFEHVREIIIFRFRIWFNLKFQPIQNHIVNFFIFKFIIILSNFLYQFCIIRIISVLKIYRKSLNNLWSNFSHI